MILTVSLICGVITLIYLYLTWTFDHWVKRNIPGPKPVVLVGNSSSNVSRKQSMFMDFHNIYKKYKDNSRFVGIFIMRNPQILVLDAGLSKDILIKNFRNFHYNYFAALIDKETDPIFLNNPFMLKGEEWKVKRSEITPAFTTSRIKAMYPLMQKVCMDMTEYIIKEIDNKCPDGIETRELSAKYATDGVSKCAFGLDAESFKNSDAKIRQMGKKIFNPSLLFIIYFVVIEAIPIIKRFHKMPFIKKDVGMFFTKIMTDAIDYRLRSKTDRTDFLQYILSLQEKKNLDDLQMVSHAITFFMDGFETTSSAMGFTLYELAKDKRVQDKLRAEIKEVESKGELNFETVGEMPYLEQVINDAMRLNPPVAFSSKICTEDFKTYLSLNDPSSEVTIKKGDIVNIPIYSIHRDPRYYENPDQFYPERFDPENGGLKDLKDKGAFLPFTDGPKICLGMKFAYVQVKAGLVEIIKNFEIALNPKTQQPLKYDVTSFITLPVGGFWIDYKKL